MLHLLKHSTLFICIFLLAACKVGPNYHPPMENLPSHYAAANKKPFSPAIYDSIFWWHSLGSPTLVQLIHQAIDGNNLEIKIARARIMQARAALGIAGADLYPEVSANGKISRDHLSGNSEIIGTFPQGAIPLYYTNYKFGFDALWEVDFFGRTRRSIEASKARLESAIESERDVVITVAAEVARFYIQYRVYQQRIAIAKHTLSSYRETKKLVAIQLNAGFATVSDLRRVESEVLSTQATLAPLQADAQATLNALAVMVGEYPEVLSKKLPKVEFIPIVNPKIIAVGLPSDLLKRRPDIRMAERELAAATADIGVAVANRYPNFRLIGDLGSDTIFPGTFFNSASFYWHVTPQVSIPILNGGRLKSAVREREAAHDVAMAAYRKIILEALADVESGIIRYQNERVKSRDLHAAFDKQRSIIGLTKIQYRTGQTSLINVLDVERQLDQINDQYIQSIGQVTIDLVSLYKALGGPWENRCPPNGSQHS